MSQPLPEFPDLTDATILVTGGARGYGEVLCRRFAGAGALVGVLGRDHRRVNVLANELNAIPLIADVLDAGAVEGAVTNLLERTGRLDVLVNNAAFGGPLGLAWTVDAAEWWQCIEVNVRGTHTVSSAVLPAMIEAGSGLIVNIASHAGVARWPLGSAYAVSKAAVIKYGENLAAEVRRHGISVVNFHPGIMDVGLTRNLFDAMPEPGTPEGRVADWFRGEIDAGHAVSPEASADALIRLVAGPANALSGRYLTAYDDVADVVARVGDGRSAQHTLGLITD